MNLGEGYLAARGITPETIQAHNIEIDAPPSEERILERLRKDILLDGVPLSKFAEAIIWFAIQGLAGDVVSYIARPLRSGETAPPSGMPKFLTPFGGTAPPFISPSTLAIRKDISIPLLIPEGPVKALSLGQAGGCAAGLSGVWAGGWKTEADKYILRPELASFQLAGRKVPLAFDADFRAKADVRHAMIRQAFLLSINGADVYQLTNWEVAAGKGIDDYLVQKAGFDITLQRAALKELMERAAPFFETITPSDLPFVESELQKVQMSEAQRAQLCKRLAKPLGVSVEVLRSIGRKKEAAAVSAGRPPADPEPWGEVVDGAKLLNRIYSTTRKLVIIGKAEAVAITLYIALTHFFEHLDIMPYLHLHSPVPGCGKSTLTDVMRRFVHHPKMGGGMSDAALYHCVAKENPTVFMPEFEALEKTRPELMRILNAGHTRWEAWVTRHNADTKENEDLCTFGPKVFSSIKPLVPALKTRSISIEMQRRLPGQEIMSFRDVPSTEFEHGKAQLIRWVADKLEDLLEYRISKIQGLDDRQLNNWEWLLAVAAQASPRWHARGLAAAKVLCRADFEAQARTPELYLLGVIYRYFKEHDLRDPGAFMISKDLYKAVADDSDAPWQDWNAGRGLAEEKFGSLLRGFGIKAWRPRGGQGARPRGYSVRQFSDAFSRYLQLKWPPDPEKPTGQPSTAEKPPPDTPKKGGPRGPRGPQLTAPSEGNTSSGPRGPGGPGTLGVSAPVFSPRSETRRVDLEGKGSCVVISTPTQLQAYAAALAAKTVSLDIETKSPPGAKTERKFINKKPAPALDWQVASVRLVSLYIEGDAEPTVIDLGQNWSPAMQLAAKALFNKLESVEIIGHNLAFDLAFLGNEFSFRPTKVWDTCTAIRLLENDDKAEVKYTNGDHYEPHPDDYHSKLGPALGHYICVWIDKELGGGGQSDFHAAQLTDEQYVYSGLDVRYLHLLAERLRVEIAVAGMEEIAAIEMELISTLAVSAELAGIPADAAGFDKAISWRVAAREDAGTKIEETMKAAGFDTAPFYQQKRKRDPLTLNPNSKLLKEAFFANQKDEEDVLIVLPKTKKGNPSFTDEALKDVKHPVARAYRAYNELHSAINTLQQRRTHIWEKTGCVHPTMRLLGANTGRITVADPAMQNVPREERGDYGAPAGKMFVNGDLSKIELRAQAHFSGDPGLKEIFTLSAKDPDDPQGNLYAVTGAKVGGGELKEIHENDKHPSYLIGKRSVLSFGYGMQPPEFSVRYKDRYTLEEAIKFHRDYFLMFSGLALWHANAWENIRLGQVIEGRTILGRRRLILPHIPGTKKNLSWRQFQAQINFLVQGSCADGLKIAIIWISRRLPKGARIILTVHDELLILCDEADGAWIAKMAEEEMVKAYQKAFGGDLQIPIIFKAKPIKSWAEK